MSRISGRLRNAARTALGDEIEKDVYPSDDCSIARLQPAVGIYTATHRAFGAVTSNGTWTLTEVVTGIRRQASDCS
jgi:hypothetical protein